MFGCDSGPNRSAGFGFVDVDERLGLDQRRVAEENSVNDAEDGRVRADADGERQHGHR